MNIRRARVAPDTVGLPGPTCPPIAISQALQETEKWGNSQIWSRFSGTRRWQ